MFALHIYGLRDIYGEMEPDDILGGHENGFAFLRKYRNCFMIYHAAACKQFSII